MNKYKLSVTFVVCLIASISAFGMLNPTLGISASSATECPNNEPPAQYVDKVVAWVAQRDGLSPSTTLPSPMVSPLQPPAASAFNSPLPTPSSPSVQQNVGNYLVHDKHYAYIPELGKCYVVVVLVSQHTGRIDKLMLDAASLTVSYSYEIDNLRAARRDPVQSKIDTALKNRMTNMTTSESVQVMVWFGTLQGNDVASRQERVFDYLVKTYPQAAKFMKQYGKPLGVDNSPESQFIKREYDRLMNEGINTAASASLTSRLTAKGIAFKDMRPMPAIVTNLSQQLISDFAADDGVEKIYLAEAKKRPSLLDAAKTQALTSVWASGLTGARQTIAIVEAGNVQRSNTYLNFEPVTLVSLNGEVTHTTNVAAAAASFYNGAPGSGRSAKILSAGTSTEQSDSIFGLQWATSYPQSARIANNSEEVCMGTTVQLGTIGFDYWARQNNVLITVSAGNGSGGGYVCSPATAYNVLAVGSFDNQNTPDWADDIMSSFSSWRNPTSAHSDREKPEVVTVGERLTILGWNNSLQLNQFGTSFAAPQVAGLDALLINKNPSLAVWPEASRAIIMASAIHNIQGSPRLTATVDISDGVGAIVGDQSVAVAALRGPDSSPCYVSCWWGESMSNTPRGSSLTRTFYAQTGQRVRVAIAWWATADSSPYTNEVLDTDLDLKVKSPSGYYFPNSISTSYDNNYELVDFDAPETGTYTIEVYKSYNTAPSAPPNFVGIAVVTTRYSVYIPTVIR